VPVSALVACSTTHSQRFNLSCKRSSSSTSNRRLPRIPPRLSTFLAANDADHHIHHIIKSPQTYTAVVVVINIHISTQTSSTVLVITARMQQSLTHAATQPRSHPPTHSTSSKATTTTTTTRVPADRHATNAYNAQREVRSCFSTRASRAVNPTHRAVAPSPPTNERRNERTNERTNERRKEGRDERMSD